MPLTSSPLHRAGRDERRVAVVIPLYNHESYIEAAIESVLRQTRPPDRLIVIDDGSTDGSVRAAQRALASAGAIPTELRVQRNRGAARTLNEAIAGLTEEIVAILNSDDLWAPLRLELLLRELAPGEPGLAFSGVGFFGDAQEKDLDCYPLMMAQAFHVAAALPTVGFALLLKNIAISTGNFVFTRDLHWAVGGFDENMPTCHDWKFVLSALRFVEPVLIPDTLYQYRIHADNTYRKSHGSGRDEMRCLHASLMSWITAPSENPLAPTPVNFPRLMPFFVPLWLRSVGGEFHAVPRLFQGLASQQRERSQATVLEVERQAIRLLMGRIGSRDPEGPGDPPSHEAARSEAAAHWSALRPSSGSARRPLGRQEQVAARFEWAGATVTVASHDLQSLQEISAFTGLRAVPASLALGCAEINLLHEHEVFVHDQHRVYANGADRLIWVSLTVGELLARHAGCPLLHAAAIEVSGRVALVCGEPFSGKSTTSLRAMARGLPVLGDDQVRVLEGGSRIQALPRPFKLRVDLTQPYPEGVTAESRPLRGRLDGEATLLLRRGGAVAPTGCRSIAAIFHLSRREDQVCVLTPLAAGAIRDRLRPHLRGPHAADPHALDSSYRGLLAVPHYALEVGEGQSDAALDDLVSACRSHAGLRA